MIVQSLFINGSQVGGNGSDGIGVFDISGTLIGDEIEFQKQYRNGNTVIYKGFYDGNVIQG